VCVLFVASAAATDPNDLDNRAECNEGNQATLLTSLIDTDVDARGGRHVAATPLAEISAWPGIPEGMRMHSP
jgi:hypothetical protein